jgi:hypothetical protein
MQMKQPTSTKGNNVYHTHTLQVEAMTPVVMLVSHGNTIEASDVAITTDTLFTCFDGILTASTLDRPAQDGWLLPGDYRGMPYFLPADALTGASAFTPVVLKNVSRSATTTEADADIAYRDLSLAISEAYAVLSPHASQQAIGQLTESIAQAEHTLTYRTTTAKADITAQADALRQAVALYQADLATGIRQPAACTASEPKAAYYTLSGVRTSQPRRGIVLMRQGNKTRKILIK